MAKALLVALIPCFLLLVASASRATESDLQPFFVQAQEKYAEGDYNAARDLLEEIVKREPRLEGAGDLLERTKRQLERLAREAYLYGVEAERTTQLEMARSYWNRGNQYVRPGDTYHRQIASKLEKYR